MSTVLASEITTGIPRINDTAPNFTAETTQGTINFHEWIGDGWAILFSHPKDFTPVCTTELGYMAGLQPEFAKRNTKIIGLSVDPVSSHGKWAADIEETQGHKVNYPMIGDPQLKIAKLYGMLPAESGTTSEGRTAADNATVRTVFVVGPDKKIKLQLSYPMSTGRNFDEILRVLDSMQLTAKHKVATPVNWKPGDDVIILPSVSNEEAQTDSIPEAGSRPSLICASCPSRSSRERRQHALSRVEGRGMPVDRGVVRSVWFELCVRNRSRWERLPIRAGRCGSACGPVIIPVFKTGGRQVFPVAGGFDPHSLPPNPSAFSFQWRKGRI